MDETIDSLLASVLELVFQFLVFEAQPLPLLLRTPQVLAEPVDFPALVVNDLLRVTWRRGIIALRYRWLCQIHTCRTTEISVPRCLAVS
jgi:hypothetical protein